MREEAFEALVDRAMADLPESIRGELHNVGIVIEPHAHHRTAHEVGLAIGDDLLGLYEGTPKTERGGDYWGVTPDKITIYRETIIDFARDDAQEIEDVVRDTVWHEIGHHLGFDDDALHAIEDKWERRRAERGGANGLHQKKVLE